MTQEAVQDRAVQDRAAGAAASLASREGALALQPTNTTAAPDAPPAAGAAAPAVLAGAPAVPAGAARDGHILPPKRKRRGFLLPLALLAAVGFGGYKGYQWWTVDRFIVSTDDAYVKADLSIIAAKVSGYVASVKIVNNATVAKGDILATIDDGDYQNAVDMARARIATQEATVQRIGRQIAGQHAAIDQARAQLQSAKADAVRDASEYDRAENLMRSSFGTQQKLEAARADRDRTAAAVANAAASVTAAEDALGVLEAQKVEAERTKGELVTALDKANRDLSFTVIRAPFDGVVGNKSVTQGQYVQPGTRLLALVPLDSAYVEANFKETQLGLLQPGQMVVIRPDAYDDHVITGRLASIAPASGAEFSMLPPENATGNFTKIVQRVPVRIVVPPEVARQGFLRPGLSVVVDVHTRDASTPAPSLISALGVEAPAPTPAKTFDR